MEEDLLAATLLDVQSEVFLATQQDLVVFRVCMRWKGQSLRVRALKHYKIMTKYQNFFRGNKSKKMIHENGLSCDAKTSFDIDPENYEILGAGKVLTDPVDLQSRLVDARIALEHEALELLEDRLEFICSRWGLEKCFM